MLSNVFRFLRLSIPNLCNLAITVCPITILIGCSGNKKRILDNFEIHEDYRIELVASEPRCLIRWTWNLMKMGMPMYWKCRDMLKANMTHQDMADLLAFLQQDY